MKRIYEVFISGLFLGFLLGLSIFLYVHKVEVRQYNKQIKELNKPQKELVIKELNKLIKSLEE